MTDTDDPTRIPYDSWVDHPENTIASFIFHRYLMGHPKISTVRVNPTMCWGMARRQAAEISYGPDDRRGYAQMRITLRTPVGKIAIVADPSIDGERIYIV